MLFLVALYFVLATLVVALLVLPQARERAMNWAQRLASGGAATRKKLARGSQRGAGQAVRAVGRASSSGAGWFYERRLWIVAGVLLVIVGPLVALGLAMGGFLTLEGYDHRMSREVNDQVATLLAGEQLAPPAPVPPELFMTKEIEQAIPMIRLASRQWDLLDADFRQRMLIVFKLMKEQSGYDMVLLEGYRSPERQNQLLALGANVTRAGAGQSYHQYGLAADCAFMRDGRIVISEQDPWVAAAYAKYGDVARSVGLTWGGGWQTIRDYGHVELRREGVLGRGPARTPATPPVTPAVPSSMIIETAPVAPR